MNCMAEVCNTWSAGAGPPSRGLRDVCGTTSILVPTRECTDRKIRRQSTSMNCYWQRESLILRKTSRKSCKTPAKELRTSLESHQNWLRSFYYLQKHNQPTAAGRCHRSRKQLPAPRCSRRTPLNRSPRRVATNGRRVACRRFTNASARRQWKSSD